MSGYFYESFDNGTGALNNTWGRDIDTSVRGQVTVGGDSGMMEKPWGDAAGHGYGTYTITAKLNGYDAGPAGLLWPGNDQWPGPEMDMIEFIDGHGYSAQHWRGNGGGDAFRTIEYWGVDTGQTHTYWLDWQAGKVTVGVDGKTFGSYTDNVARDYDHGGVNMTMSIMNRNPGTSITVYDVSYSPNGGSGVDAEQTDSGSWQDSTDWSEQTTNDANTDYAWT